MELEFATLQSYLTWRADRRVAYKVLSETLRSLKGDISETMRHSAKTVKAEIVAAKAEGRKPKWHMMVRKTAVKQNSQIYLRATATAILKKRGEAKVIAGSSWTKWRETNQPP